MGNVLASMAAYVASQERQNISRRTRAGWTRPGRRVWSWAGPGVLPASGLSLSVRTWSRGCRWRRWPGSAACPGPRSAEACGGIMAAYDSHGVVVVRVSRGTIHRPNYGISAHQADNHGNAALLTGDWELFPNLQTATETDANYTPCAVCFPNPTSEPPMRVPAPDSAAPALLSPRNGAARFSRASRHPRRAALAPGMLFCKEPGPSGHLQHEFRNRCCNHHRAALALGIASGLFQVYVRGDVRANKWNRDRWKKL